MKKIIAIIAIIAILFTFCSCGKGEKEFKTTYITMYDELQTLNTQCDELSQMIYTIWEIVGTDNAPGTIAYMLQISSDFDDYWDNEDDSMGEFYECLLAKEYGWVNNSTYGISYSADAEEFHALCMKLQQTYNSVKSTNEALPEKMKTIYSEYNEDFGTEYELLNELYLEVSSYAEFSLSPAGSLMSYPTEKREYQETISKLIKSANIY